MNKKADAAKMAGLLCVPLVALVVGSALQHRKVDIATRAMFEHLSNTPKPDKAKIEKLILSGADVNGRSEAGRAPLHLVATFFPTFVPMFLDHGADVNVQDSLGQTPLMEAATQGDSDTVRLLLYRGANVNLQSTADIQGRTALSRTEQRMAYVVGRGRDVSRFVETIQLLKAAGAKE